MSAIQSTFGLKITLKLLKTDVWGGKKQIQIVFFPNRYLLFRLFFRRVVIHHRLQRVACIKLWLSEGLAAFRWDLDFKLATSLETHPQRSDMQNSLIGLLGKTKCRSV